MGICRPTQAGQQTYKQSILYAGIGITYFAICIQPIQNGGSHYKESYSGQESKGKDSYGNSTYTAYEERYAYQNATGRDEYGNPTYNN